VIPEVAAQVVGQLGPIPPERRLELRARGLPDGALVGISGLERVFNDRLAGRPGGTLFAGGRVLGSARLRPGRAVRTTIDPELEAAAIGALAGRAGGVAVLSPDDGEVLALAGVAYSGLGPPGSTFKIVTTTAGLEEGAVKLSDEFPVRTAAVLEGVELENANGESCGGSFTDSFAHSCNSVFAPLGAKVGGPRLVREAEQYGFNRPPGIDGAETSTIPAGDEIGDDLAVGATAIGQGKVQASALQMASVAATIANRGVRATPTLALDERSPRTRVTTAEIAATVRRLMVGVVKFGTGTAADISGVAVAGKTGTAELGNTTDDEEDTELDTDAWFVAFAPARSPRLAVAVVMFQAGAGGASAAPVAREVLASALTTG
jgi:cell division protein FtsI/penicillin-binding protein 2